MLNMSLSEILKWWDVLFSVSHEPHINQINPVNTLWKFLCADQGIQFTMVQTNRQLLIL